MTKWIETTGRSEEDAISAALFQLGLDRDDISIEVLQRPKTGFLGFGAAPAKVRVSYEVDANGAPIKGAALLDQPAPKAEPVKKVEAPKAEKKVETPKVEVKAEPVKVEEAPVVEQPAAVEEVEEETILVAKSAWKAPETAAPAQKSGRSRSRNRRERSKASRVQEGDEVLIGKTEKPHSTPVSQAPTTPAAEDDEKAKRIVEFLNGLMEHMDVTATPVVGVTEEGNYKVILEGDGLGAIIGRRGETLDAIQQLTNYTINRGASKRVRIHIDAEGYRAKREDSLHHLALKVAGKVVKYRKNMTLEPMNAYERHVIHAALQDVPKVTTFSTGVEPNRHTVVCYSPDKQ